MAKPTKLLRIGKTIEPKKNSPDFSLNYFLLAIQKKVTKKRSPAYNLTVKNLLAAASLAKLLALLVGQ